MKLENTEDFLRKFDYHYKRNDKGLIIEMDYSQKILVDFSNPNDTILENRLIGWNFLTGIIPLSIKNAVMLNLIIGLILSSIIALNDLNSGIYFFLAWTLWVMVWFNFYYSQFDKLKQFLIKWNN